MRHLLGVLLATLLVITAARAGEESSQAESRVQACIIASAEAHRLPPSLIVILLKVEGGELGAVSGNTNDTVDIGPMQVNSTRVQRIAQHWRTTPHAAYAALRDNFCANIEAGAWILRQALDEGGSDFWSGVGIYHSHNPVHKAAYLRKVLEWTLRLRDEAQRSAAATQAGSAPAAPRQAALRN
jgi:hypothetical protein